jgi:hypothetical protein
MAQKSIYLSNIYLNSLKTTSDVANPPEDLKTMPIITYTTCIAHKNWTTKEAWWFYDHESLLT